MTPPPVSRGEETRALVVLLSVIFLNIAGFGLVIPLLPFFGKSLDAPAWQIAILFSAFSFGQFLGEPFWGRMSDRVGRRPVLMITIAGGALAYVALAFAPNIWLAFLARFVGGVLSGNISTLQGALADITRPEERAAKMGLMGSAFSLGFMVGLIPHTLEMTNLKHLQAGSRVNLEVDMIARYVERMTQFTHTTDKD